MQRTRRKFAKGMLLGLGAGLGGGSWWVAASKHRAARWMRAIVADARRPVLAPAAIPDPTKWSDNGVTLAWLGHSTVLINLFGVNILTDPTLGRRVGISLGMGTAGPKRYIAPALTLKQLPRIDLVLLSHAHMDHMDLPTLSGLGAKTRIVTAPVTRDVVASTGAKQITELGWNESTILRFQNGELEITGLEVKHWGQRWPKDLERGYNGYALKREGKSILFGGDTAHTPVFKEHRSRGPFDVAIMPIGAYDPWIWNHCSPEQAVQLAEWAGAKYFLPVHHKTFRLSNEPMNQPIERVEAVMEQEKGRLALKQVGETFVCPTA